MSKEELEVLGKDPKYADLLHELDQHEREIEEVTLYEFEYPISFMVIYEHEMRPLFEVYKKCPFPLNASDVTDEALYGFYGSTDPQIKDAFTDLRFTEFLNRFIKQYATKDMILDKIGKHGLVSLSEVDKEILSHF